MGGKHRGGQSSPPVLSGRGPACLAFAAGARNRQRPPEIPACADLRARQNPCHPLAQACPRPPPPRPASRGILPSHEFHGHPLHLTRRRGVTPGAIPKFHPSERRKCDLTHAGSGSAAGIRESLMGSVEIAPLITRHHEPLDPGSSRAVSSSSLEGCRKTRPRPGFPPRPRRVDAWGPMRALTAKGGLPCSDSSPRFLPS